MTKLITELNSRGDELEVIRLSRMEPWKVYL